jgi:hypothetical protein
MTTVELAHLALEVLEAQRRYFASRETPDLIASNKLEKRLKAEAEAIINVAAMVGPQ